MAPAPVGVTCPQALIAAQSVVGRAHPAGGMPALGPQPYRESTNQEVRSLLGYPRLALEHAAGYASRQPESLHVARAPRNRGDGKGGWPPLVSLPAGL